MTTTADLHPHDPKSYGAATRPACATGAEPHDFVSKVVGEHPQTNRPIRETRCKRCDEPEGPRSTES